MKSSVEWEWVESITDNSSKHWCRKCAAALRLLKIFLQKSKFIYWHLVWYQYDRINISCSIHRYLQLYYHSFHKYIKELNLIYIKGENKAHILDISTLIRDDAKWWKTF